MANTRKKLLLVTAGFPFGDVERGFLQEEFNQMHRLFDVYILCVGSKDPMIHPHPEEVPVERYFHTVSAKSLRGIRALVHSAAQKHTRQELKAAFQGASPILWLKRMKQILFYHAKAEEAAAYMARLQEKEHFDLIYTYWCCEMTLAAVLLKQRWPELPVITRFHGHDLFADRRATCWQPYRPFIARNAEALVFACRMGKDYFLDTWGREFEGKSLLHYLGSADTPMPPKAPSDVLRLVSCSNLIPLKRVERIIDGISLLPPTVRVRWDHFGDGSERQALERRAAEKLGKHVSWQFHGRVPNNTLADHYRQLDPDLFLTTTSTEGGTPVSLQEAFCMGIPAIGTAVGGIPELIQQDKNGWLLPESGKAEDLAQALGAYLQQSPQCRSYLSANARSLWEQRFDASRNAEAFLEVLRDLMSRGEAQ